MLKMSRAWRSFQRVSNVVQSNITTSAVTGSSGGNPNMCVACLDPPTLPRQSNCGHTYCYYCLRVRLQQAAVDGDDGSFACLKCGAAVRFMRDA